MMISMQSLRGAALAVVLLTALAPSMTEAQSRQERDRAEKLEERAYQLFDAKDYLGAAARLRQVYEIVPNWGYLWNIGRALELGGDIQGACAAYRQLVDAPKTSKEKRAEARAKLAELSPRLVGGLALSCEPEDATFEVKGPGGTTRGRCPWQQEGLKAGTYHVEVKAEGFAAKSLDVQLAAGKLTTQRVELDALSGRLLLRSSLAGGQLYVDGARRGTTPSVELELAVGTHELEVRFPGRGAWKSKVMIPKAGQVEVQAEPPSSGDAAVTTMAFQVQPDKTKVFVDNRFVGVTPLDPVEVMPGSRRILLKAPGHESYLQRVEIAAGARIPVVVALKACRILAL